jgi:uncharacterized damage-inducible protein DinB
MINEIINQLNFNRLYARKLIEDIPQEQMNTKPGPGLDSHPAFTIGHLVTAYANLMNNLTGEYILAPGFKEIFLRQGPGDPTLPEEDANVYPSKEALLQEMDVQHGRLIAHLRQLPEEKLHERFEWRLGAHFPTYGNRIMFLCVNHYAMHLGQLAAWRRAMGYDSALAKL